MKINKEINQRKLVEIFILLLIIFVPYFLGFYIGDNKDTMCCLEWETITCDCCIPLIWLEGICYIIGFGGGVSLLVILIIILIQNNWKKSIEKAEKEVKKQ